VAAAGRWESTTAFVPTGNTNMEASSTHNFKLIDQSMKGHVHEVDLESFFNTAAIANHKQ
jgi:hypothetical protein